MKTLKFIVPLAIAAVATPVLAGITQQTFEFETPREGWFFAGGAGLDNGKGLEHSGVGNGWVRNTTGWNAVNQWINISAPSGSECTASAWLRTSDTLTDGYMTIRDADKDDGSGRIIHEIKLVGARPPSEAKDKGYHFESFDFTMGTYGRVLFYVGLWGTGKDAWIQIDDAAITCKTPF